MDVPDEKSLQNIPDSIYPRADPEPQLPLTNPILRIAMIVPNLVVVGSFVVIKATHSILNHARVDQAILEVILGTLGLALLAALTQLRRVRFAGFMLAILVLLVALALFMFTPVYA